MKGGRLETRLLENTLVFAASGLMHSLVRWTQDGSEGDIWCIAIWYTAQMLPIIMEGMVQDGWVRLKKRLQITDGRALGVFERLVGYVWVVGWFMWSVPKQIHTRNEWTERLLGREHPVSYASADGVKETRWEF